jgi:hypothetical protein
MERLPVHVLRRKSHQHPIQLEVVRVITAAMVDYVLIMPHQFPSLAL